MKCELAGNNPISNPIKCISGNPMKTIYVFGDSHSSNLIPSINKAAKVTGYENVKYLSNAWSGRMNGKH